MITRKRIEHALGWVSILFTVLGFFEKGRHYVGLASKAYRKHNDPGFGFAQTASRRRKR